ncbi:hypothetical protein AOLI_G00099440 [Acnodon oligacanthus]
MTAEVGFGGGLTQTVVMDHAVVAAERAGDLGVTANADPTTYTSLVKCQAHSSAGSALAARRFESHCQLSASRA